NRSSVRIPAAGQVPPVRAGQTRRHGEDRRVRRRRPVAAEDVTFARSSKNRLTDRDLDRFSGKTIFDRIGCAVCEAGCLPRKELYEAWEVARRVRRLFRGGRIVDLAAGHGLLAQILLLLDDSSPAAIAVDTIATPSAAKVHAAIVRTWPRLSGRVDFRVGQMH